MNTRTLTILAIAVLAVAAPTKATEPPAQTPAAAPVLTRAPELLHFVEATYPEELFAAGTSGEVLLAVDIDAEGKVQRAEVLKATHEAFAAAAQAAVLRFVFRPAEIDGSPAAIRIEYRYVFAPREVPPPPASPAEAAVLPVRFFGVVREAGTRKPIAGASIHVDGEPVAETDATGAFAVRSGRQGTIRVRIEAPTHEPYEVEEELRGDEALEAKYYLRPRFENPFQTIVRGRAERREVTRVKLAQEEVRKVPGTFGDPVRVIENLPGMGRSPGGLGGALIVHGAAPQDTATYVDGVPIPLLYHVTGLVSVINPEFLDKIDFYPGGFGARYGRATAGVVEVSSKELACDTLRGSGKVDVMDAAAFVCAPAGSWQLAAAGRRSYIDAIIPALMPQDDAEPGTQRLSIAPVYWDYQAKAQRRSGAHSFDVLAFGAHDTLELVQSGSTDELDSNFGGAMGWHRLLLRHRYDDGRVTITSSLTPGYIYEDASQSSSDLGRELENLVSWWTLDAREEISLKLHPAATLNAGLELELGHAGLVFDTDYQTTLKPFPVPAGGEGDIQRIDLDASYVRHAYWTELVLQPTERLRIVPGLRVERFDWEHIQRIAPQPRLNTRYDVLAGTALKAAYGWYEKLSEPVMIVEGFGNPYLDPERAHHLVAGLEQELPGQLDLDVSGFYTWRRRLPSPSDRVVYRDGQAVPERWDSSGRGRAFGVELLLRRPANPGNHFHGWLAYTLSRSTIEDASLNPQAAFQGADDPLRDEHLSPFDQTHILTMVGQWTLPYGFEVGLRYQLSTGTPITPMDRGESIYDADSGGYRVVPGSLTASERLPTFHRLDVRVDRTFTFDLWKLGVYLEVLNAYNHKNVEAYAYDYRNRTRAPISFLPIIPTLGVKGEF